MTPQQPETAFDGDFAIRDPQQFANNMVCLAKEVHAAVLASLQSRAEGHVPATLLDDLIAMTRTFAHVHRAWLMQPMTMLGAHARLWQSYADLWSSSMLQMMGMSGVIGPPHLNDTRFRDPAWAEHRFFDFLRQSYLINSAWAKGLIDDVEGLDPEIHRKARFYTRQIISAIAPSNWVFTNPELLRETFATDGENLVRGMQLLREDIQKGGGKLRIRQTDTSQFEVGRNLATTPGKVIFRNDLIELIQYEPTTKKVLKRPLLIVPPWINKFYILDLSPEKSFIRWAVDQGHTVFILSWANPDESLGNRSFEDYMREGILDALCAVEQATGEDEVNAIGYCVGGTLLSATLAYLAAVGDTRIRSATFFATQVDFQHAGDLKVFLDEDQVKAMERDMAQRGYLDSSKLAATFNFLRPDDLVWPYIIHVYLKGREPLPFDLLHWNADSTRMPAANHSFYLRHCYLQNDLAEGRMEFSGVRLNLSRVRIPIYHLAAADDHIAPAQSVFVGAQCFGGPVEFVLAGSGHIAGVINPPAKNRYQHWTGGSPQGSLESWLAQAEEHAGSWWPHWQTWIAAQCGERVAARPIGAGKLKPLEDAPGSYVLVQ